jgi:hypothetical protein
VLRDRVDSSCKVSHCMSEVEDTNAVKRIQPHIKIEDQLYELPYKLY